jgi:hypothetical protein
VREGNHGSFSANARPPGILPRMLSGPSLDGSSLIS